MQRAQRPRIAPKYTGATKNKRGLKMAKMTFTKWLKQAKANTKIIERLEQIKYDYEQGRDLSYDDLAFLQSQQDFIKKEFCDDIVLWQIAGIDESDWNNAHKGGSDD